LLFVARMGEPKRMPMTEPPAPALPPPPAVLVQRPRIDSGRYVIVNPRPHDPKR
jgi:hypothetical protein